jgi:hypothetical protein
MKTRYEILLFAIVVLAIGTYHQVARAQSGTNGTLQGTVRLEGTPAKAAPIDMSADPYCAKANPGGGKNDDVVTDSQGHLANVLVYVSDGLAPGQTFEPPATPVQMVQKACMYRPRVLAMRINQKLDVVNDDKTTHNIHPLPTDNREWNKSQPPGVPIEETFARQEVPIPVKCNVHPWMKSYIAVFKHPFFAVTNGSGTFELKNLPPGTYTITAWHEKLGTKTQKVTILPNENKSADFTFTAM